VHQKVTDEIVQEFMIPATFHPNLIAQRVLERNLHRSVTEQFIARMKTPTLIIWGKHDVIFDTPRRGTDLRLTMEDRESSAP